MTMHITHDQMVYVISWICLPIKTLFERKKYMDYLRMYYIWKNPYVINVKENVFN